MGNVRSEVIREFLRRYREDRAGGTVRSLEEYQALWPGHEDAIAGSFETERVNEEAQGSFEPEGGTFGPYRLERELGRGGQAVVHLAEDVRLGRKVALKILRGVGPAAEDLLARFRREAAVAARLEHPGICAVHETGVIEGTAYIAMQYVEGVALSSRISTARQASGRPPSTVALEEPGEEEEPAEEPSGATAHPETPVERARLLRIVGLVEEAARALHVAHEAGIVHRDVKPGNIMVTPCGRPMILDFGLAREAGGETLTLTGDLMGTPAYMSPEQLLAHRVRLDRRTDVYSLGVVLFECLTLRRPFEAPTREALYQTILSKDPPDIRKLNKAVPDDLRVICETAIEKDRDRRYQTAEELAEELRRFREREPIRARPVTRWVKLRRWAQRNPAVAASLAALIVVLLAGTTVSWIQTARADRQSEEALANLAAWQRMSDVRLLKDLQREADEELWPAWPAKTEAMEAWLRRASDLLSRREAHERTLAGLRARALPCTDEDRREDRRAHPEAERLAALEARLREEALERPVSVKKPPAEREQPSDPGPELTELSDLVAELEARVSQRRTWRFTDTRDQWRHDVFADLCRGLAELAEPDGGLVREMRDRLAFASSLRRRTIDDHQAAWEAAIARVAADARFAGFELVPQVELVPLGPDPESGLEEFGLYGRTGIVPLRDQETGKLQLSADTGVVLVLIPGGRFWMGAQRDPEQRNHDPYAHFDESPVHAVELAPFLLSKYELTQGQWRRFTGDNPSYWRPPSTEGFASTLRHPLEQVSWVEAMRLLPRLGLTLPTEAQWEHACRAGTETVWWCGDDVPSIAARRAGNIADRTADGRTNWTCTKEVEDGHLTHAPVGSFAANGFGLHDVLGNVFEWCRDGYGGFASYELQVRPGDGLRLVPDPRHRVFRGGSYSTPARDSRSAFRLRESPGDGHYNIGVRPARRILP